VMAAVEAAKASFTPEAICRDYPAACRCEPIDPKVIAK
jgi:hypothetical protein